MKKDIIKYSFAGSFFFVAGIYCSLIYEEGEKASFPESRKVSKLSFNKSFSKVTNSKWTQEKYMELKRKWSEGMTFNSFVIEFEKMEKEMEANGVIQRKFREEWIKAYPDEALGYFRQLEGIGYIDDYVYQRANEIDYADYEDYSSFYTEAEIALLICSNIYPDIALRNYRENLDIYSMEKCLGSIFSSYMEKNGHEPAWELIKSFNGEEQIRMLYLFFSTCNVSPEILNVYMDQINLSLLEDSNGNTFSLYKEKLGRLKHPPEESETKIKLLEKDEEIEVEFCNEQDVSYDADLRIKFFSR